MRNVLKYRDGLLTLTVASLLPLAAIVAGCNASSGPATSASGSAPTASPIQEAFLLLRDLNERVVSYAPLIVVAKVEALTGQINASRDLRDATKPSSVSFAEANVYRVSVEHTLKGPEAGAD